MHRPKTVKLRAEEDAQGKDKLREDRGQLSAAELYEIKSQDDENQDVEKILPALAAIPAAIGAAAPAVAAGAARVATAIPQVAAQAAGTAARVGGQVLGPAG